MYNSEVQRGKLSGMLIIHKHHTKYIYFRLSDATIAQIQKYYMQGGVVMENVDRSIESIQEPCAPITDSEQVVLQFADMVYRLALVRCKNRTDADDVFQNVFYRYLKYTPSFESFRHQRAWFVRATINCSNSLLASVWRKRTTELDENLPAEETSDLTVYNAVRRLPKDQKTVIHLYYYEGYTVAEIADIMTSPQGTVKSWLSRARTTLKKELKGEF